MGERQTGLVVNKLCFVVTEAQILCFVQPFKLLLQNRVGFAPAPGANMAVKDAPFGRWTPASCACLRPLPLR